jgi:8-oxo-dGTP diphosphatase
MAERVTVVAAAILRDGRVLGARRARPPELAGRWELPGGKVEPGESDEDAVRRECREELGVEVTPGERIGPDVTTAARATLRVYLAQLAGEAEPDALEHSELRWLAAGELGDVAWIEADAPIVAAVRQHLCRHSS